MSASTFPSALLKEPLVPFLLAGALCYWAFASSGGDAIQVDSTVRQALAEDHLAMTGQAPSAAQLDALVERWIGDEILFREALARELHRGDVRTRHRLIDKMRFLLVAESAPPTPEQLLDFYLAHIDDYRTETQLTFDHRFWPDADAMPDDARARLNAGEELSGSDYWLGDRFDAYHLSMLRSIFGGIAVRRMLEAEGDVWTGPLASPRGLHLVRITDRLAPQPIPFEEARTRIAEDWIAAERRARLEGAIDELKADYEITVDE